LACLLALGMSACGSAPATQQGGPDDGQPVQPVQMTPTSNPQASSGTWQTVATMTGSSTSQSSGGGTNINQSSQSTSFSADGPYQILAACQGSGTLTIEIDSQPPITVGCTSSQKAPSRVAGADTPGGDGSVDVTVTPQGQIPSWLVLAQVKG
jgi:hypothetical protein